MGSVLSSHRAWGVTGERAALALPSMVHETLYLGKLYGIKRAHIDRLFLCRSPFKAPRAPLKSQSGFRRFIPFTKVQRTFVPTAVGSTSPREDVASRSAPFPRHLPCRRHRSTPAPQHSS